MGMSDGSIEAGISAEIKEAMTKFGATSQQIEAAEARPQQAYKTLELLGARSDLLSIIGSLDDTMDDQWVLENLHRWNTEEP